LYGIVFRILQREDASEEVLQSVFLKIWNSIDLFDDKKATIFTWMAQIARNTAIDRKRLKSFEMFSKTETIDGTKIHDKIDTNNSEIDLETLIKNMPEKLKLLVEKMFLEGYTQQEIAEEFDLPLGTVKTRLREAIRLLREILKEEKHLLYMLLM